MVRLFGRVSEFISRPVSTEATSAFSEAGCPVEPIRHATHLAKAHGIETRVAQSEFSRDYLSLIEVSAVSDGKTTTVAETLLEGRLPSVGPHR